MGLAEFLMMGNLKCINDSQEPVEIENIKLLLCAIIKDAVMDYQEKRINRLNGYVTNKESLKKNNDYLSAKRFLKSKVLMMYCKLVGINHGYVRRMAFKRKL